MRLQGLLIDSLTDKHLWSHLCVKTPHINNPPVDTTFSRRHGVDMGVIFQVSGNAEYSSADLIVDYADNGRVWQRRLLASLVATTAIATILWYSRPRAFAKIFNISVVPHETVLLDV